MKNRSVKGHADRGHPPASESRVPPSALEKQKILIVDDRRENLTALRQILRDVDADIIEATNGNQALAATLDHHFAVAVLDVMMPEMNGYELAEHLRGDEKTRMIPIMFLTASLVDEQHAFQGYEAGAVDYIVKPFAPEVLLGKVRVFLEMDRYRSELKRHRDHLEMLVAERTRDLRKRVKEVECLYAVSSHVAGPCSSIDEALRAAVDLIPPGWQHPDITRARIVFEGREYVPEDFRETAWKQSADIVISEVAVGTVEVFYLEQRPECDEGPFQREERNLIDDIAKQLGVMIARHQAESRLEHINHVLRTIRNVNQLIVREKRRLPLIQTVCEHLTSMRSFRGAWIVLTGRLPEDMETAHSGLIETRFVQLQELFRNGELPACCRRVQEKSGVIVTMDPAIECEDCPLFATYEGDAALTIGLQHGDRLYGYLGVSVSAQFAVEEELAVLFEEVAGDIAYALHGIEVQEALQDNERRFHELVEGLPQLVWTCDPEGLCDYLGRQWIEYTGMPEAEQLGYRWLEQVHPEDRERTITTWNETVGKGESRFDMEFRIRRADGVYRWFMTQAVPLRDKAGNIVKWFGSNTDIDDLKQSQSERLELEAQFRQAQKMEAVGQLAGGIAHDFNNLLLVIMGQCEMLAGRLGKDDPLYKGLLQIRECGERAAGLTRQLLTFSRKQIMEPQVLDLNALIVNLEKMLCRLLGEDVELETLLAPDLGRVKVDPGQLEQVIVNLAVNARDAMPRGGRLTIESADVELDQEYAVNHVAVEPGHYVMIAVSDNGIGMDEETQARVFEPFFTTKARGDGTGLGLSTAYGIVKQSKGSIWCYSEPDKGTTFKVYLPRIEEEVSTQPVMNQVKELPRGSETVLVVEDDDSVRLLVETKLTDLGYTVIPATSGEEALESARGWEDPIGLLLTDVILPGMNGAELAGELTAARPGTKVIFMSGYTDNVIIHHGMLDEGVHLIQKPFTMQTLAMKVREVIDSE